MSYNSLKKCISDLDKNLDLRIVSEEVSPELVMASIHIHEFQNDNKALLYKNVRGSKYTAVSNLFGSLDRSRFLFRKTLEDIKLLIALRNNPMEFFNNPLRCVKLAFKLIYALPKKVSFPSNFREVKISDLPQIKNWPEDGGAFITLPQVYSEDLDNPGILGSNLGMYRIQISGNEYKIDKEIGMHYQIHRGIGVHQKKAIEKEVPLKVSIFIGGNPAHTFAAVMPLPEGMTEIAFAGMLAGRRFRYAKKDGYTISTDADFVICGEIHANDLKPEGPFGDHLGYYSLKHDFPVLRVHKVFAKEDGIWPFTVVGRPPQEDSQFGALIHEITGAAIQKEIPGLQAVNAVDYAGVHPLLLAVGSERYTPYNPTRKPQELLTIANHILGTGQMSLAKFLFICDEEDAPDVNNEESYFSHFLKRVDWGRDLHFHTKTTIDTLDYSGDGLNEGSKLVIAAAGDVKRELCQIVPNLDLPLGFSKPYLISDGNLIIESKGNVEDLICHLEKQNLEGIALITLVDDSIFVNEDFSNWLWVTFTRSNPAADIYGLKSKIINKHFSCSIPIIDATIKDHHAPTLLR